MEHISQSLVLFPHQIADCTSLFTETQGSGSNAVPAELVKQARQRNIVTLTDTAVLIDKIFRHDKQRNTLDASWRVPHSRQHQVDDILRQGMITARDKNLGPGNTIIALFSTLSSRGDIADT